MTFSDIETRARELARMSTSGASQASVFEKINDAIVEFGRDAYGLPYEEYVALSATFDLETTQAFHLTIIGSSNNDIDSDIVVTSASASNQTGTETATMLQAQIRAKIGAGADLTVAWASYYFTVSGIDSTSITIEGPDDTVTYEDYVSEIFGGDQSGVLAITGDFPQDCTVEATLHADSIRVDKVLWDDRVLRPITRDYVINPEVTGTPAYYNVRGTKVRLVPVPTEQERFFIEYKGVPTKVTTPAESSNIPDIPAQYQRSLAYLVARDLLFGAFEDELANRRYAEYKRIVNQYKIDYANNSTETSTQRPRPLLYSVESN